jgi:CRISPR-associated protein Csx10
MKLTFKISLESDYHIGTGYGKGIIDSSILKDRNGLPIIRGTTLGGLLRQGMRDLLQLDLLKHYQKCEQSGSSGISYCSESNENPMCPICRISGTPAYAKKWSISSADIEESSTLRAEKIVWRNRVNPITRSAESRKLFNEETVDGKISFVFTLNNESSDVKTLEEASFIAAAFRMVRNFGSSRRRGKGRCQIHLVDFSPEQENITGDSKENELLDIFQTRWLENKELNLSEKKIQIESEKIISPNSKCFNLIFLTKEPLLIASRSESGNRFQTQGYIPGYTILGALAWKVANRSDLNNKEYYDKFINLFRRGKIKVSPLYPCWKIKNDIYPTTPWPRDFLTCKLYPGFEENGHEVKGYAVDKIEPNKCEICLKSGIETPLEPLDRFLPLREKPEAVDVALREEIHISINPENGITEKGDLFSYTLIESGQYFIGTIEIVNFEDFVNLLGIDDKEDISFELRVGKASSRGYGHSNIWLQNPEKISENFFIGKPLEMRIKDFTEPITMTLITDAIVIDEWGRFYSTLNKKLLDKLFDMDVELINAYVKSINIDGFNTYLGLPKWRDYAIVAGSSVGFRITSTMDNNELYKCLSRLEKEGVGLRRDEGFGKVAFNHPVYIKNDGVSVSICLSNSPEFMQIPEKEEEVRELDRWWKKYLRENLNKKDFDHLGWIAVARWLRENSKKSIEKILEDISNFHTSGELVGLVKQRRTYRDKINFLDDEGNEGFTSLSNSFIELSKRLELENKDETIRRYLQVRAIEILVDIIASFKREEND